MFARNLFHLSASVTLITLLPLLLIFTITLLSLIQEIRAIEASPFSSDPPYTDQQCNFTAHPKNGCEDDLGAECVDQQSGTATAGRCRCKPGHAHLVDGRFCFRVACPPGQYHDAYESRCVAQRRASSQVAESHCRYDYHCFGPHVRCRLYGWNRNCVCNPGFIYGYNGTCIPLHGIGGHCSADADCDQTGTRKMFCEPAGSTGSSSGTSGSSKPSSSNSGGGGGNLGGTCQCMSDHTYNYQVDGCESNERIRERRNNMRTLILLFVLCATVFGFALTFNFGLFGSPSRAQQAMLLKRLAAEKERAAREAEERVAGNASSSSGGGGTSAPSAPPVEGVEKSDGDEKEIMFPDGADDGKTAANHGILVVDLDMVDDDVDEQQLKKKKDSDDNSKPSSRLISLY